MSVKVIRRVFSIAGATLVLAVSGPTQSMSMEKAEFVSPQNIMSYDELIGASDEAYQEEYNAFFFEQLSSVTSENDSGKILKDYLSHIEEIKTGKNSLQKLKREIKASFGSTMFASGKFEELNSQLRSEMQKLDFHITELRGNKEKFTSAYHNMITDCFDCSLHDIINHLSFEGLKMYEIINTEERNVDKKKYPDLSEFLKEKKEKSEEYKRYFPEAVDSNLFILWGYKNKLENIAEESFAQLLKGRMPDNIELENSKIEKSNLSSLINIYIGNMAELINLDLARTNIQYSFARKPISEGTKGQIVSAVKSILTLNENIIKIYEITHGSFPGSSTDLTKGISFTKALSEQCKKVKEEYSGNYKFYDKNNHQLEFRLCSEEGYINDTPNLKNLINAICQRYAFGSYKEKGFISMPNFLIENPSENEKYICFEDKKLYFLS